MSTNFDDLSKDKKYNDEDERENNKAYLSICVIILIVIVSLAYLGGVTVVSVLVFRKLNACEAPPKTTKGYTVVTNKLTFPTLQTFPPPTTMTTSKEIYEQLRLPNIYQVSSYNLKLKFSYSPNSRISDGTGFNGSVDIIFNLTSSTSQILFHVDPQLQILDPIVVVNQLVTTDITTLNSVEHRPVKNDYHFINSTKTFNAGSYKMTISFVSQYQSLYDNKGIFAVTYVDDLLQQLVNIICELLN